MGACPEQHRAVLQHRRSLCKCNAAVVAMDEDTFSSFGQCQSQNQPSSLALWHTRHPQILQPLGLLVECVLLNGTSCPSKRYPQFATQSFQQHSAEILLFQNAPVSLTISPMSQHDLDYLYPWTKKRNNEKKHQASLLASMSQLVGLKHAKGLNAASPHPFWTHVAPGMLLLEFANKDATTPRTLV